LRVKVYDNNNLSTMDDDEYYTGVVYSQQKYKYSNKVILNQSAGRALPNIELTALLLLLYFFGYFASVVHNVLMISTALDCHFRPGKAP
jgi:hypothetical protein